MTTLKSPREILDRLKDLKVQAANEKSHYYVASVCHLAIELIEQERAMLDDAIKVIEFYSQKQSVTSGIEGTVGIPSSYFDNGKLAREFLEKVSGKR